MKLRGDPPAARRGLAAASSAGTAPVLMVHLAALTLALGPPIFFGAVVAPESFRVLPTRDLAAQLVSPILLKGSLLAEVAFGVLLLTSWFLTRRDTPRLTRVLMTRISVIGFFAALVIRQLIVPAIDKIRADAAGLIDNLPAADPDRLLLSRYHRLATGFFTAEILAGLIILVLTARLLAARRESPPPASAARPPVPKLLDLSNV